MTYLTFDSVSKQYENSDTKENLAVNKADIKIAKGELVVFVGPSGCGKSTLLRMVAGLEDVSDGQIILDGKVINDLEVDQRDIAMVFQDYALYPHMSVKENMSFGLENQKMPRNIIDSKTDESSELLELSHLMDRLPKQLSGGQRQRVALGRALVKEPKVFLLDEPLSNLDAKLRIQTRKMIASLHEKLNATMIYVTHDQIEAMTLGDKIVVLNGGKVQQVATPEDLYFNPANAFVASFIGTPSMNLFNVSINEDKTVVLGQCIVSLENYGDKLNPYLGKEVILGIRPEDIVIKESESSTSLIPDHIEFLGSENLLYFTVPQGEFIVKLQAAQKLNKVTRYDINFNEQKIYLFDLLTENKI